MGYFKPVKGVLFDLYGTLAYIENPVDDVNLSDYLVGRGYEIYPQSLQAAFNYVAMIDYPKYGFRNWRSYLRRVFYRLGVKLDRYTLESIVRMFKATRWVAYPDAYPALEKLKSYGIKTCIVSTVASFMFKKDLKNLLKYVDVIIDGYSAGCEKSNPRMYITALKSLNLNANEVFMVGDNAYLDGDVPSRVGIKSVLLVRSGTIPRNIMTARNLVEAIDMIIHGRSYI